MCVDLSVSVIQNCRSGPLRRPAPVPACSNRRRRSQRPVFESRCERGLSIAQLREDRRRLQPRHRPHERCIRRPATAHRCHCSVISPCGRSRRPSDVACSAFGRSLSGFELNLLPGSWSSNACKERSSVSDRRSQMTCHPSGTPRSAPSTGGNVMKRLNVSRPSSKSAADVK